MPFINFKFFFIISFFLISFDLLAQKENYLVDLTYKKRKINIYIYNNRDSCLYFFDKKIEILKDKKNKGLIASIKKQSIQVLQNEYIINLSDMMYLEEYFFKDFDLSLKKQRFTSKCIEPKERIIYQIKIRGVNKMNKNIYVLLKIDGEVKKINLKKSL